MGQPCVHRGVHCHSDTDTLWTCEATFKVWSTLGGPCDLDSGMDGPEVPRKCPIGTQCDDATATCIELQALPAPLPSKDEPCSKSCAHPYVCDFGHCRERSAVGEPCDWDDACASDRCVEDLCAESCFPLSIAPDR